MRLNKLRSPGEGDWAVAFDSARSAIIIPRTHFMCGCFSKRCKTCQTLYQSRMTRAMATGLLLMLALPFASAKSQPCPEHDNAQANENDRSVIANPGKPPT